MKISRPSVLINTGGRLTSNWVWAPLECNDALQTSSSSPPSTTVANEADEDQQDNCADGGIKDRRNKTYAKMDAELRKQPAAKEGTNNADDNVADDSKAAALQDLARQPSGNKANY